MSPLLYGVGGAALGGILLGWTVRDWKSDSDALAAQEAAQERFIKLAETAAQNSIDYEAIAQIIRANERTDRIEIREVFRDVEVPSDCAVPDAGVGLLDNAVERANAAATGQPIDPLSNAAEAPDPID